MSDILDILELLHYPGIEVTRDEAAAEIERLRSLLAAILEANATFQGGAVLGAQLESLVREALGDE